MLSSSTRSRHACRGVRQVGASQLACSWCYFTEILAAGDTSLSLHCTELNDSAFCPQLAGYIMDVLVCCERPVQMWPV